MSKIKSIGLITLGKKSYIDKLEGVDANGNIKHDYHVRLKGISPAAIEDHVTKEQKRMQAMINSICLKDCLAEKQ